MNEITAKIESLLFIQGQPITYEKIAKLIGVAVEEINPAIDALQNTLTERGSGLTLLKKEGTVQLISRPEFGEMLSQIMKDEFQEELTPAALETLTIISYAGPVSRNVIDYIRGVNSSFILRNLLIRGLIDRKTDPKRPNSYIYEPSFTFLKHIGVTDRTALPEFEKFRGLITELSATK